MKAAVAAWLALLLAAGEPHCLTAQVAIHVSAGARYSSTLVRDSIVAPFTVRPAIAPAIAATATLPLDPPWSALAVLDVSRSEVRRLEADGTTADVTAATTLALSLALERRLRPDLAARVGIGLLKYLPSEDVGLFRDGGGALFPLGQVGVVYAPPFGAARGLALEARYDLHRFITPALRNEGFTAARTVHRVALALVARLRSGPPS